MDLIHLPGGVVLWEVLPFKLCIVIGIEIWMGSCAMISIENGRADTEQLLQLQCSGHIDSLSSHSGSGGGFHHREGSNWRGLKIENL